MQVGRGLAALLGEGGERRKTSASGTGRGRGGGESCDPVCLDTLINTKVGTGGGGGRLILQGLFSLPEACAASLKEGAWGRGGEVEVERRRRARAFLPVSRLAASPSHPPTHSHRPTGPAQWSRLSSLSPGSEAPRKDPGSLAGCGQAGQSYRIDSNNWAGAHSSCKRPLPGEVVESSWVESGCRCWSPSSADTRTIRSG